MSTYSKRRGVIVSIIISFFICLSLNFILIKFKEKQEKNLESNFILKTSENNPDKENKYSVDKEREIYINDENIVLNQYKNNSWRILIPKINLDAPILEGTEKEILRRGVGHYTESSKWNGNVVLAAHNRGYKYNFFQEIKRLEIGDSIEYETTIGKREYKVIKKIDIKETDLSCLENTKENILTLLTCLENMPEYRVCIQAALNKEIVY